MKQLFSNKFTRIYFEVEYTEVPVKTWLRAAALMSPPVAPVEQNPTDKRVLLPDVGCLSPDDSESKQ